MNFNGGVYEPERCWVGDKHKICYGSQEEAELAARCAEFDHGLSDLTVYKCEYGEHWHIASAHGLFFGKKRPGKET